MKLKQLVAKQRHTSVIAAQHATSVANAAAARQDADRALKLYMERGVKITHFPNAHSAHAISVWRKLWRSA